MDVKEYIVSLCKRNPDGILQGELEKATRDQNISPEKLQLAINDLISKQEITILEKTLGEGRTELVFRVIQQEEREKLKDLSAHDVAIYKLIKDSLDKGISKREIIGKSELPTAVVTKSLSFLEKKKIIKHFTSFSKKSLKLFILYDVQPSREKTGGSLFSDGKLDVELVNVLKERIFEFVVREFKQKRLADVETTRNYINSTGIFTEELDNECILSIIKLLIYDGALEETANPKPLSGSAVLYKPASYALHANVFTLTPCSRCPVASSCAPNAPTCPEKCKYLDSWLDADIEMELP